MYYKLHGVICKINNCFTRILHVALTIIQIDGVEVMCVYTQFQFKKG